MVDSFAADAFPRWNFQFYCPSALKQLTIIGRGWAKYHDLSMASRSISRRQIIDLRDTDKSRYFAITEFNNCFIIRSPTLFFLMNILGKRSDLPFSRKSDRKKEKSKVSFTHMQNIICSQSDLQPNTSKYSCTALRISRPLFVGSYLQVTWWAFLQFWVLLGGDSAEERAVHERYMMLAYVQWRQKTSYKYGNGQLLFKNQSYF